MSCFLSLRVSELEQDNKMSASNLGIVFGPTLMRPKPTGATVSLSSLVDYPHQARIVEAMIVFQQNIFISSSSVSSPAQSQVCTQSLLTCDVVHGFIRECQWLRIDVVQSQHTSDAHLLLHTGLWDWSSRRAKQSRSGMWWEKYIWEIINMK